MLSKVIPRKLTGFEVQVTENPRWKASILLYLEPDTGESETKMVQRNLRRNPTVDMSATYNKYYVSWSGQTQIDYCKNRTIPDEEIKQLLFLIGIENKYP